MRARDMGTQQYINWDRSRAYLAKLQDYQDLQMFVYGQREKARLGDSIGRKPRPGHVARLVQRRINHHISTGMALWQGSIY